MDQYRIIELKSLDDLGPPLTRAKDEGWASFNLSGNSIGEEGAKAIAASLPNLTSLYLEDGNIGDEGAKALAASLPNLTSLELSFNRIGDEGAKALAASLPNLTSLHLGSNRIGDEGAKALAASLPNLTSLYLGHNSIGDKGAKAIAASLHNLTLLNLFDSSIGDEGAKALAASLPNLTSLHLSLNNIGEEGAKAIAASRPNLTSLNLDNNNIGDEGARALAASLHNLTWLNLHRNSIGDEGAKALAASLPNLTSLDLSLNNIGDEGAKAIAASLPNLTLLELSHNSIGDEGAKAIAASLPKLTSLYLWNSGIGDEGAKVLAASLPILTSLNLGSNSIGAEGAKTILESWTKRSGDKHFFYLNLQRNGDLSTLLPDEILANPDDPTAILAAYRRLAAGDKRALNEAKLLVVGKESVGKTSLVRYLIKREPCDPSEKKTPGIAQEKIETERWSPGSGDLKLNVWDFGGQEIYYETHRFFLTARSLYLLVLSDREKDDQSVFYWLKTIRNRGANSPVLVVINKSYEDKLSGLRLDETGLRQEYPEIVGFLRTSCNDDEVSRESIQVLREKIVDTVTNHEGLRHVRDEFAPSWLRIKDEITSLAAKRAVLPPLEFQRLCEQGDTPAERVTGDDERRLLLHVLKNLGTIVAYGLEPNARAVQREITLLDPNWLTAAVYKILTSADCIDLKGEFTAGHLAAWLDPSTYPPERHEFILDMMQDEEVGLCFALPGEGDKRYLVPEALAASPPYLGDWPEDCLRFRYRYDLLPRGLVPRFIVEAHTLLIDPPTRWRTGAVFEVQGCPILVQADLDQRQIDISVKGPANRRRGSLGIIIHHLDTVHARNAEAKPLALVPLPDQPERDEEYNFLLTLEEEEGPDYRHRPTGAKRSYTVAELLDGVRHSRNLEHRSPKEAPSSIHIEGGSGPVTVVQDTSGDVKIETEISNAPPRPNWADALTSWRLFSLAAATAAVILAVILYLIPSWELRLGIAGLAAIFVAVYLRVAATNPERFFRRWIARTILAGLVINLGGIAIDTFITSGPATGWLRFDSNVSLLFNIAWPMIVAALAALEWQRMQQAGKMSPA